LDERKNINNSNYFPNIHLYYQPVDDSVHYKILEEANIFVANEIRKLTSSIESTDKEIIAMKRAIKENSKI
jgi:hypothetical protein